MSFTLPPFDSEILILYSRSSANHNSSVAFVSRAARSDVAMANISLCQVQYVLWSEQAGQFIGCPCASTKTSQAEGNQDASPEVCVLIVSKLLSVTANFNILQS